MCTLNECYSFLCDYHTYYHQHCPVAPYTCQFVLTFLMLLFLVLWRRAAGKVRVCRAVTAAREAMYERCCAMDTCKYAPSYDSTYNMPLPCPAPAPAAEPTPIPTATLHCMVDAMQASHRYTLDILDQATSKMVDTLQDMHNKSLNELTTLVQSFNEAEE